MKYDYIKEVNIYMPVAENYKDIGLLYKVIITE